MENKNKLVLLVAVLALGFGKLIINAVNTSSYEDAVQQAKTFVQGLEVQKFGQINI